MRLFVAVDVSEDIRKSLSSVIEVFCNGRFDVRPVKPENLHFTLKFLGGVREGLVEEVKRKIKETAKERQPFEIEVKGIGFFGSEKFLRVVWAGAGKGKEEICLLSSRINKFLDYIRKDEYETFPHITLFRVLSGKNRDELIREIETRKDEVFGSFIAREIKLKRSVIQKGGPVYTDLATFRLGV